MDVPKDFADLCSLLTANKVEYLVVGGYAVGYHGAPRATGDIDLLIGPEPDNAERMLQSLALFGFPVAGVTPEYIIGQSKILQIGRVPWQVYLMTNISGVAWAEAWASRSAGNCGNAAVYYIGLEPLLKNKRSTGRLKDQADVEALTRGRAET
jgi:hypothetical protein